MRIDYLASTTQERIRDLLRPVKGEVEDPKKARITQAELARLLNVNEGTISRFMSGKTMTITNENLVKIATRLNVSTDYLLGLTDIKDKMNHAASELGLTNEAAQNLYTHKVNPDVVNLLLTNETFIGIINRLVLYFDETVAAGYAVQNQQIAALSDLLKGVGTPGVEQTTQTIEALKTPIYQAEETMLQNDFLTAIRQIKMQVGENRAEQAAQFTDEVMKQFATSLDKGELSSIPQTNQYELAEKMLSPINEDLGISAENLQDLRRAFGNVMNDLKTEFDARKQALTENDQNETREDYRCGG